MIKNRKLLLLTISVLAALSFLSACGKKDLPPDPGTPEPEPHEGVFVSAFGTMTFPGDGESIEIDFLPELAEAVGLSAGKQSGTYVFLFGHGEWRYDAADRFRVTVKDASGDFLNVFSLTDEKTIALLSPIDGQETIFFVKSGN